MADELVWYVAFGSNLASRRLGRYLEQAPPIADPADRVPVRLPHRLYFAGASSTWDGGGTAFVDPDHLPGAGTCATAWLLRPDQFAAVLAGENGRDSVDVEVGELASEPGASTHVLAGRYGLVLACASPDDRPAFTVTAPEPHAPSRPADRYLDTIVEGLVEGNGLTEAAARAYLDARRS